MTILFEMSAAYYLFSRIEKPQVSAIPSKSFYTTMIGDKLFVNLDGQLVNASDALTIELHTSQILFRYPWKDSYTYKCSSKDECSDLYKRFTTEFIKKSF